MKNSKTKIQRDNTLLEGSVVEGIRCPGTNGMALLKSETLVKKLNEAVEEERSRIAREIHDQFGQGLSGLKMSLSSLKNHAETSSDLEAAIDRMLDEVDQNIYLLRKIANELRPVILDKLGLFAALEWVVREFENKTGITTDCYIDIHQPAIHKTRDIHLFRICQEALTNIAKHAKATRANIKVENQEKFMHIQIADNGKGIQPVTLHHPLSMGMSNMAERANLIGAKLNIKSSSHTGTIIELIVPVDGKENSNSPDDHPPVNVVP